MSDTDSCGEVDEIAWRHVELPEQWLQIVDRIVDTIVRGIHEFGIVEDHDGPVGAVTSKRTTLGEADNVMEGETEGLVCASSPHWLSNLFCSGKSARSSSKNMQQAGFCAVCVLFGHWARCNKPMSLFRKEIGEYDIP